MDRERTVLGSGLESMVREDAVERSEFKSPTKLSIGGEELQNFKDPLWGASQLQNIFLFKKLTMDELKDLYASGTFLSLVPGAHAVIEGEMSRSMYLILKGSLSVLKNDPVTGSLVTLAMLEPGANFGELSLFDDAPRSATVVALSSCLLFCLDQVPFNRFLEKWGGDTKVRFYRTCAEELAVRFRKLNTDFIQSQRLIWRYALSRDEKSTKGAKKGPLQP